MQKLFRSSPASTLGAAVILISTLPAIAQQIVPDGAKTTQERLQGNASGMLEERLQENASTTIRREAVSTTGNLTSGKSSTITGVPARVMVYFSNSQEKGTYLGVAGSPVMPALREQLNLKRGTGVLVEQVEADSPAQMAGVKQYDILEKLDDQILINGQQLAVLVRIHKADEEIKLTIIRQGQRQTVTAKLIEKDVPVLDEKSLWGMPGTSSPGLTTENGTVTFMTPAKVSDKILSAVVGSSKVKPAATISDDKNTYKITSSDDGNVYLTVTNKQNEIWYTGIADEAQKSNDIPSYVKDMISKIKATKPAAAAPQKTAP